MNNRIYIKASTENEGPNQPIIRVIRAIAVCFYILQHPAIEFEAMLLTRLYLCTVQLSLSLRQSLSKDLSLLRDCLKYTQVMKMCSFQSALRDCLSLKTSFLTPMDG